MSRCIAAVLLVAGLGVAPVCAQELQSPLLRPLSFATPSAAPDAGAPADQPSPAKAPQNILPATGIAPAPPLSEPRLREPRKLTVNVMCVSFAALQAFDLHSTFKALDAGAREGNVILGGFASNKAAMVGFKAATTAGTIYLVQRFGVKNRVASTIFLAAANSAYAIIAAHNYRLARSLR